MVRGPPISLTLKQKLGSLASAATSPRSPNGAMSPTPLSPSKKRPGFFPNWGKRSDSLADDDDADTSRERIQDVMAKLIFQAGVDFETRPMVVISASAFPDPRDVSYDVLLHRIMAYLDLYVESDYTVVFLAAGNRHTPGWNWVWKAYRSLSRKYRKNLKRLYIVHSTWFSKMLFSLAGAVVSPKFFRKILYVNTLSALAQHVPLTQIDIPPSVYQENLKHEKQIALPVTQRSNLFGVPLEELMGADGEKGGIPRVIKDCAQFIREQGLDSEGLFRRSPASVLLQEAKQAYDRGHPVSLSAFGDPHLAAVLIKKFFRDLPEPVVPEEIYPLIKRCPRLSEDPTDISAVQYIRESILPALHSQAAALILSYVLHLLHEVSLRSTTNRMDAHNLALVFTPNLVSGSSPVKDVQMCYISGPSPFASQMSLGLNSNEGRMTLAGVVKICIERYFEVFDDIHDRAEAVKPSSTLHPQASEPPKDDDDSDGSMLVMPIGPSRSGPPSAWNNPGSPQRSRFRVLSSPHTSPSAFASVSPSTSAARSLHAAGANPSPGMGSVSKARSLISIEKVVNASGGRGSITLGRPVGTLRKGTGAAVEAVSVTASGFFSPPSSMGSLSALAVESASPGGGEVVAEQKASLLPNAAVKTSPSISRELSEVLE